MASVEHPHVVRVYGLSRTADGCHVLAMEYVDGETLADRIRRQGCLGVEEALTLVRQVAEALEAAWERGVIHRDIKPSNLFVDRRGQVRVGDFGLARAFQVPDDSELTAEGDILGTPAYLAPEQARGEAVDFRADVYSLGVVLFEMLDGDPPFEAQSPMDLIAKHLRDPLPVLRLRGRAISDVRDDLHYLLRWMTEKDRLSRPGSYQELIEAVDDILAARPETAVVSTSRTESFPSGRLVVKRCDRLRQVMAFARHFREHHSKSPGRPQIYLLYGEEGQGHDALVDRFVYEHVARSMEQSAAAGGVLTRRLSWPGDGTASELQSYLVTDLFTELDPSYSGVDVSATTLVDCERLSLYSAIIVQHEIRIPSLHRRGLELMDWYLNDFWSSVAADTSRPQVLVFLQLIYPRSRHQSAWRRLLPLQSIQRRASEQRIRALFQPQPGKAPRLLLSELGPITVDHVKEWFSLHNVLDTDKERRQRAETLFSTPKGEALHGLPMDEVEHALSRIHAEFLQRKGMHP